MILGARLRSLFSNSLLRSAGVLLGGTAFAHAILALALPVVTRLYTPDDFNVLAVFASLLLTLSVAACLRFDLAIPIAEHAEDAFNVLALALLCALLVSAALAVCVLFLSHDIANWLNTPELESYLWLVPLGVLVAACASALQFWHARIKAFGTLARTRIGQSCAVVATQIGCGWLNVAPLGLLLGQVLNSGASVLSLGYRVLRNERALLSSVSWRRMRAQFVEYDRFPKYSTVEALANVGSSQLPIVLIAALAAGPEAGYLALALAIVQAPTSLIGGAAGQVYLSHAAEEHRAGRLGAFTVTVVGGVFKAGAGPLLLAGIVAPDAFAIIFGEDWRRAGVLVTWMVPGCVMQLLSFPVSMALPVVGRTRASLVLMLAGLAIRVGMVYAALFAFGGWLTEAYALSALVFYTLYLALVLRIVAARRADLYAQLRSALPIVGAWCAGAAVVAVLLRAIAPSLR